METPLAILMADLSGYTALTEVHGAEKAADLVERFLGIVNRSLVGDCRLHERVGDQVMIISASPEALAYTATALFERAHDEEGFLPLHAGLHYGPVVQNSAGLFGSAVNTTARIVAAAERGKMLCSNAFLEQLPPDHPFVVSARGPHHFKNLQHPVELYELHCCISNLSRQFVTDPVCRMLIARPEKAVQLRAGDTVYYFCSDRCREIWKGNRQG